QYFVPHIFYFFFVIFNLPLLPNMGNMQNSQHRFFHILSADPFHFTVESMAPRKYIRTGQPHKGEPRAIRTTAYTSPFGCKSGTSNGLHTYFHNLRMLIEHLFHVPILFFNIECVSHSRVARSHSFHD